MMTKAVREFPSSFCCFFVSRRYNVSKEQVMKSLKVIVIFMNILRISNTFANRMEVSTFTVSNLNKQVA
ncbi:MAG: hypothetical protein AUK44_01735 [Porphyromonadaceae bacterium CG2_30_38_12]|nr:MAG: hypothetical protein AUK44_01735 [Porphyromonadaceae bacterium CG2_30_38_12]